MLVLVLVGWDLDELRPLANERLQAFAVDLSRHQARPGPLVMHEASTMRRLARVLANPTAEDVDRLQAIVAAAAKR